MIVTLLTDKLLLELHTAAQALGLETLVETHSVAEVARVVGLGLQPDLLGINNRDIRVHETDDGDVALTEDALGFVVEYPQPTPWTLTRRQAADLMRLVPPFVSRVAVVGSDATRILAICAATQPDAVQLHGDETEAVVAAVAAGLRNSRTQIIKTLRIYSSQGAAMADQAAPEPWAMLAQRFLAAGANAILLDAKADHRPGGTGQTFDWQIARQVAAVVSLVILAGGLTPANVGNAIAVVQPYAVDVISAVADERRRKVQEQVYRFVQSVRQAAT